MVIQRKRTNFLPVAGMRDDIRKSEVCFADFVPELKNRLSRKISGQTQIQCEQPLSARIPIFRQHFKTIRHFGSHSHHSGHHSSSEHEHSVSSFPKFFIFYHRYPILSRGFLKYIFSYSIFYLLAEKHRCRFGEHKVLLVCFGSAVCVDECHCSDNISR